MPIQRCSTVMVSPAAFCEGRCMGYLISFVLGIFVATVGVSGAAAALDKAVQKTQLYIRENLK
jgi:uncharacterized protein GlcG (DUF336 family)